LAPRWRGANKTGRQHIACYPLTPSEYARTFTVTPSTPAFFEAAASVLQVRPEWLAFGSGSPQAAGEMQMQFHSMDEDVQTQRIRQAMLDALSLADPAVPLGEHGRRFAVGRAGKVFGSPSGPPSFWVAAMGSVIEQFYEAQWFETGLAPAEGFTEEMIANLCRAMVAPMHELGIDARKADPNQMADYIISMLAPLLSLAKLRDQAVWAAVEQSNPRRRRMPATPHDSPGWNRSA